MKKRITILALLLLACGCSTVLRQRTLTFDDAVRDSIQTRDKHEEVVLTMDRDGSLSIASRPIKTEELKSIRSVAGLPENPPAVLLRAHREASHANVTAIFDELSKAGIWRIAFQEIKEDDLHNQASQTIGSKASPQSGR